MKKYSTLLIISLCSILTTYSQDWVWSNQLETPGDIYSGNAFVTNIITDDNSNIYHCGCFDGSSLTIQGTTLTNAEPTKWDAFIAKYDTLGNLLWLKHIAGAHHDEANAMAIIDNYIFVIGNYRDDIGFSDSDTIVHSGGSFDTFLAKYDLDGNFIKATQIFWSNNISRVKDMTLDKYSTELVLTGFLKTELNYYNGTINVNVPTVAGGKDMFIAKADTSGTINNINIFWTHSLTNGTVLKDINVAADTSYYLSGDLFDSLVFNAGDTIFGASAGKSDALLIKVDKDLNKLWTRTVAGTGYDHGNSGVSDINGNIYLTGKMESTVTFDNLSGYSDEIRTSNGASDLFIAKYYPDGRIAWVKSKGSTGYDNAYGSDIHENLIQFCGSYADTVIFNNDTLTSSSDTDVNTGFAIFDLDGNEIGAQGFGGTLDDQGQALTFNNNGNTIIAGYFYSASINIGDSSFSNTVPTTNRDGFIASFSYPFKGTVEEVNSITCPQGNNGQLIVKTYFGVGPYTYEWSSPDTSTIETSDSLVFNLAAGTYSVTITDSRGEKATPPAFVLADPDDFNISLAETPLSCFESGDGAISTTVSGGTPSYNFAWEGPSGDNPTLQNQSDLTAGKYVLTVTDSEGCQAKDSINVTQPLEILFGNVTVLPADPVGTGSIDLDVSGGAGNYTYAWVYNLTDSLIGRTNDTLNNLLEGDYKAYVTDQDLCKSDTMISVAGEGLRVDLIGTNVTCYNDDNGNAYATIIGGRKAFPFLYTFKDELDNTITPVNDSIIQNLAPGKYFVTVEEQGGENRTAIDSVTITQPDSLALSFDTDSVSCFGDENGVITLFATGGNGSNTYLWSNGSTSKNLTNVPVGRYTVQVTDAKSCMTVDSAEIEGPVVLDVNIGINQVISCFGFNNGRLIANVTGGIEPYSYSWDDPGNQINPIAVNLFAGDYSVLVTDNNGCSNSNSFNLKAPLPLRLASVDTNHVTCLNANDGSISVAVEGGTSPYTFSWNQAGLGNNSTIEGLFPVLYELTVNDINNCINDSLSFQVKSPPSQLTLSEVTEEHSNNLCFGDNRGMLAVDAAGGWGGYQYSNDMTNWQADSSFTDLLASAYSIAVRDSFGCIINLNLEITEPDILSLSIELTTNLIEAIGSGGTPPYLFSLNGGAWQQNGTFADLLRGDYSIEILDANGCGPVSENTRVTDLDETIQNDYLQVYPNPSSGLFYLSFNLETDTELNIEVYSVTGGQVYNRVEILPVGNNQVLEVDLGAQEPGVYLLQVNGIVLDTKLIVE